MSRWLATALVLTIGLASCDRETTGPAQQTPQPADEPPALAVEPVAPVPRESKRSRPRLRGPRIAEPPAAGPAGAMEVLEDEHPDEPLRVEARRPTPGLDAPATTRPVFFGLLHAHTLFSDGSGTPEAAYARAKQRGVDFLAVTPHNHALAEAGAKKARRDGVLIANTPELYEGPSPITVTRNWTDDSGSHTETLTVKSVQAAAADEETAGFVTLFGQEFSTISSGNHVNVLGAPTVITTAAGEYRTLYEGFDAAVAAGGAAPVLQMNHPNIHDDLFYGGADQDKIDKMFNDYGFDEYGQDFGQLVAAADPYLVLSEALSGPAMLEAPKATHHYNSKRVHDEDYYFYLIQGFHVSPSVGHDNHFETWGDATPARMGVLADSNSEADLLSAMRANRTFASEDSDLRVELRANGTSMGGVLGLAAATPLVFELEVADPTDPDTEYEVDFFYGDVQPQTSSTFHEWKPDDGLVHSIAFTGDGTVSVDLFLASGVPEFFYVKLQQGDDDRAWSAPIWVNHPRTYNVD